MTKNLISRFLSLAIAIPFVSHATDNMPEIFKPAGDVMISVMSDNALYAASINNPDADYDNPQPMGGTFVYLDTNTSKPISAPNGWADIGDIADNGMVVGSCDGKPGYWLPETDKWTTYNVPRQWGSGSFTAVTPDGHYAVGYYVDRNNMMVAAPMVYDLVEGKSIALTNLPTVDMAGDNTRQNLFYGISPDGRYALGQMSQSYMLPVAMFTYIYDILNQTWTPIGFDYDAATQKFTPKVENLHFVYNQHMSCDGAWVTGSAYFVVDGGDMEYGTEYFAPYRYNVADDTMEVYTASGDQNVSANKITADGVMLAASPIGNPYPTACVRYGNFFLTLDQILAQVYHTDLFSHIGDTVTGAFECLSADGLTAVMRTYDNSYVIRMPEPFVEAAARVDLLGTYVADIPQGAAMSKLSEIKLTFDRPIAAYNDKSTGQLLAEDGSLVRNSAAFQVASANDHQLLVTFRTTALEPGKKYTVRIPADKLWLQEDPSIKNKEINLTYVGRQDGSVVLASVSPADGSAISQFNSNPDYIVATFDCPVSISDKAECALYNADDNSLVATFMCAASGNMAVFYPQTTYYLYKGSNYKVVIKEGSVTDLSYEGASAEIVLNYTGTFVRQLSADDTYIFNANCNSYDDNFMMWKNQVHEIGPDPYDLGFTVENMWMLLRDEDTPDDWALAAHSMFETPNQSDDWLITPQLYIPDANSYLAFDAQSYLKKKNDVLRVYVLVEEGVHNYANEEFTKEFREQGDLVFEEVLSPGEREYVLSGDWTHYTVPLSKYAGKSVYIAFVNYNYDQSIIFLDNIQVVRDLNFLITNQTPTAVVSADSVTVKGIISVLSELADYQGVVFSLKDSDGNIVDQVSDPDANLKYGDTYQFEFAKPLPLTIGEEVGYVIEVQTGSSQFAYNYTVKDMAFETTRKVVLEEFTGADCPNCPLGIVAIEHLQQTYPQNFVPITMRTYGSDPLGAGLMDYTEYLGFNAAPSGRINRSAIMAPVLSNGDKGYTFYGRGIIQSDGTEAHLWADEVQDLLQVPAEAEITAQVSYDPDTREISVPTTVKFAINAEDRSLAVFSVLLEDQLSTKQTNNTYTSSDPLLGEWGAGGQYGQATVRSWKADDVARYVITENAYGGVPFTTSTFEAGEGYTMTLSGVVPDGRIRDANNCKVVVMLIDRSNQEVLNANVVKLTISGIEGIESEGGEAIYYNLQGLPVAQPQHGQIYIKMQGGKATKILY